MVDVRAVDMLFRARDLVWSGWTQNADARAADGAECRPWQDAAVEWSLLGAIVAALEEQCDRGDDLPLDGLADALHELARFVDQDSLSGWNDEPFRTQDEVAGALGRAGELAARKALAVSD